MRVAPDANILFYSVDHSEPQKMAIARDILRRGVDRDMIVPTQAIGEFLNAIRKKRPTIFADALDQATEVARLYPVVPTEPDHILRGAHLFQRYKLQFWDAVMLATAAANDVDVLLSEDMQDGATIGGVAVLNPFDPANRARLDAALA